MPCNPADWPVPITPLFLQGKVIRLEPLVSTHETELLKISDDAQIWRYLTSDARSPQSMHEYVNALLCDHLAGTALPFVVRAATRWSRDRHDTSQEHVQRKQKSNRRVVVGTIDLGQWSKHGI